MRRAVRSPVVEDVTARMSSSVCRLPFIRSSPLPALISSTAFAAAASLCGASTISYPLMLIPWSRAALEIFAEGPTRTGLMMPSCAASTAPRSEDSSQGCTTIVVAGLVSFALAISRSYLEPGAGAPAPIGTIVSITSCSRMSPPGICFWAAAA